MPSSDDRRHIPDPFEPDTSSIWYRIKHAGEIRRQRNEKRDRDAELQRRIKEEAEETRELDRQLRERRVLEETQEDSEDEINILLREETQVSRRLGVDHAMLAVRASRGEDISGFLESTLSPYVPPTIEPEIKEEKVYREEINSMRALELDSEEVEHEYNSKPGSVVHCWVSDLSWKMQTTLFCSLRGPDQGANPELKLMVRWIRSVVLKNADTKSRFMKEVSFKSINEISEIYPSCIDMLSIHFYSHLLNAFEIISQKHPDKIIKRTARHTYMDLCQYLHLVPESLASMEARLSDE